MSKNNIRKAAALLMIATVIEKLLGFGREMVIARQFGATSLTDSYFGGFLVPNFIMVLLSAGLVNVYAPVFLSEKELDEEEAWNKMNSVSTYGMILLLVISAAGILLSRQIIELLYHEFSTESLNTAASISRIFFIGVFVYSGVIIQSSLLNSLRRFIYPVISVALLSVGIIICVILFGGSKNINSIAYGYLAGAILGFILQYLKIKQIKGKMRFNLKTYPGFTSKFLKLLIPVLISTSMGQINMFVDTIFASYLTPGSMSYLLYAGKVIQLPVLIFSGIIATIVFPDFIDYINNNDTGKLKTYMNRALVATLIFLIPSFVGLVVMDNEVIKLLFERNAFDSTATTMTGSALAYYAPTVILYGSMAIIAKVYYSMKDTATLMYISIITIALNAALDYILMWPMGHNGLALATSIVALFEFIAAYLLLKRKIGIKTEPYLIRNLLKIGLASLIMGCMLYIFKIYLVPHSFLVFFAASVILGIIIYFVLLAVFKVDELHIMMSKFHIKSYKHSEGTFK